jgi:hypothetical protein
MLGPSHPDTKARCTGDDLIYLILSLSLVLAVVSELRVPHSSFASSRLSPSDRHRAMRVLLLALLGLASAFGFAPGAMPMQLQRSQASVTLSPQMKALNKPARLAEVRRKYNKNHKSEMRTYIKKARRPPL